ncbi:hypothetical protein [Rubritalea tangerina]|uniref:hypothetical protein n=1 Tax=Rubritalea tangerina TaxID=430798 RepID=UPI00361747D9
MQARLWSFIIVNFTSIIPDSSCWVYLPELSAFYTMSQTTSLGSHHFQRFSTSTPLCK